MEAEMLLQRPLQVGQHRPKVVSQARIVECREVHVPELEVSGHQPWPGHRAPLLDHRRRGRPFEHLSGRLGSSAELRVDPGDHLQDDGGRRLGRRPVGQDQGAEPGVGEPVDEPERQRLRRDTEDRPLLTVGGLDSDRDQRLHDRGGPAGEVRPVELPLSWPGWGELGAHRWTP